MEILPAEHVHGSAWPPADWQAPDFDDSTWIRDPYPQRELYGLIALRCLRGKFEVTDPARAKELSLTLRFRGGAIAYLNGQEIGRAFLPQGETRPETLAEDYPNTTTLLSPARAPESCHSERRPPFSQKRRPKSKNLSLACARARSQAFGRGLDPPRDSSLRPPEGGLHSE